MAWIEKRVGKRGNTYHVCWNVPAPDGKPQQKSKSFGKNKAAAEEYERQIDSASYRGLVVRPDAGSQLFGLYADHWLASRVKGNGARLRLGTITTYKKHLRLYLNPEFEFTELRHITTQRAKAWYDKCAQEKSEVQTKKAYKLLHAIMTTAHLEEGVAVPHLPGYGIERQRKRVPLTDDQVIEFAERISDRYRAVIFAVAFGALRFPGEVRGLQRVDVNQGDCTLRVRQNVQQIPKKVIREVLQIEPESCEVVGDPKTEAGFRTVSIPDYVMDEIVAHMAQYVEDGPTAWVFPGARRTTKLGLKHFYEEFARVRDEMGLDPEVTAYNFRHWSLTTAAKTPGMTTKNLMARGGHSSFEAALKYQHAAEEVDRAASDYLAQRMSAMRRRKTGNVVRMDRAS